MEKSPEKADFEAQLKTTFKVLPDAENEFEMTLVEVKTAISNKFQECFALLFKAPESATPEQGMFRLRHEKLGDLEIFLVPVKKNDDGLFYEAIFNKLLA